MNFSLYFKLRGEEQWLYGNKQTLLFIAVLLENFKIPYELYERHACIHSYNGE